MGGYHIGIYIFGKDGAAQHIASRDGLPNKWVNACCWTDPAECGPARAMGWY